MSPALVRFLPLVLCPVLAAAAAQEPSLDEAARIGGSYGTDTAGDCFSACFGFGLLREMAAEVSSANLSFSDQIRILLTNFCGGLIIKEGQKRIARSLSDLADLMQQGT